MVNDEYDGNLLTHTHTVVVLQYYVVLSTEVRTPLYYADGRYCRCKVCAMSDFSDSGHTTLLLVVLIVVVVVV